MSGIKSCIIVVIFSSVFRWREPCFLFETTHEAGVILISAKICNLLDREVAVGKKAFATGNFGSEKVIIAAYAKIAAV